MLLSLALALLIGMLLSALCKKCNLPGLLGMLFTGIVLGPSCLNWLDTSLLHISAELRSIALIIILLRAGLTLDINDLKRVGRPALLMSFLPALFEITAMIILAPRFFGLTVLEAALMGSVVAAVSPAVIVPKMIQVIEENYGTKKSIPQMILASATLDDVFVIVLFTSFLALNQGQAVTALSFISIPTSIIIGIFCGIVIGLLLYILFKKNHLRDSQKVIVILAVGFILMTLETFLKSVVPFSGLIAIMTMGITLKARYPILASRLSVKFSKLWLFAEVLLFVLVGSSVDIAYALKAGPVAFVLVICVLFFRMISVLFCLLKTSLNFKEKLFCMISYIPKATVQAAIGSIPLSMGLSSGSVILTVAVLSILITAPLGASLLQLSYKKLLQKG